MGAPPKEATRPPKNKAPQASKEPGSVATPQSPDSGLCLAILLDRRCKHGERCDHHQVTLEDIFEARKQRGDLRGTPSEHASPRELAQNTRLYILQDLHKTKLCKPFQLGECPRGDECAFVHIRGPDAKQVNGQY